MLALEDEVLVDLVGDDQEIVLAGEAGDLGELLVGQDGAGGVVRSVEQDQAGVVGDGVAQFVQVEAVGAGLRVRAQGHRDAAAACQRDTGGVGVVVGLQGDDLVARFQQCQQRGREGFGGARGDQDLGVGVVGEAAVAVEALLVGGDGGAQLGDAGAGWVLIAAAVAQGTYRGLPDLVRAVGVGKALAEVDGAGPDGECRHFGKDRGAEFGEAAVQQRSVHVRHPPSNLLSSSTVL